MSVTPAATPAIKRSRSDLEAATSSSPQQAGRTPKRPRVQFKSENTVHTLRGWDDTKTQSLIKEEVKRAFERQRMGDGTAVTSLGALLQWRARSNEALPSKVLKRYLLALTNLSRNVGRSNPDFIKSISKIQWLGRDEDFVRVYQTLLTSLISTYGGYSLQIITDLVSEFRDLRRRDGRLPNEPRISKAHMQDRLHACIIHLMNRVPACVGQIQAAIKKEFPFGNDLFDDHMDYVSNILRVTTYAPHMLSEIIAVIFDKTASLDSALECDIDDFDVELYNTTTEDLTEQIRHILASRTVTEEEAQETPEEDEDADFDSDEEEEERTPRFETEEETKRWKKKQEIAKLESMMVTLLNHWQPYFDASRYSIRERIRHFEGLFDIFARKVLTMQGSRFVQFVLLHFAQSAPELSERFVELLTEIAVDRAEDAIKRQAASAYLASFIARGARVSRDLVRSTFEAVADELDKLRKTHELNDRLSPDLNRFGPYYTSFQCLMYIFCYRWRDLVEEEVDEENFDVHDLKWDNKYIEPFRRNVTCRLNPLKVCSPTLVQRFALVMQQLQLLFLQDIIELNKRIRLTRSQTSALGGFSIINESERNSKNLGEAHFQLKPEFPFDAYKLPLTKGVFKPEYNEFRYVPGFEPVEEDDE